MGQKCTAEDACVNEQLLVKTLAEELKLVERAGHSLKQRVFTLERELAHSALQLSQASMANTDLIVQVKALEKAMTVADEQVNSLKEEIRGVKEVSYHGTLSEKDSAKKSRTKRIAIDPVIINENENMGNTLDLSVLTTLEML